MKLCFSLEANAEAKEICESVRNFIGQDGSLIRNVGNEAYLTFYNMTRENPVGRLLSDEKKQRLLNIKKEDLTISSITRLFGYSTNASSKDRKAAFEIKDPDFNLRDFFTLKAKEFTNQTEVQTTVGKFLFNKLFIENTDLTKIVPNGYYNVEVTASNMKKLSKMVANGCMQGLYGIIPTVADYLKAYEFWGLCLVTIVSPSYSLETILPNKQIEAKKKTGWDIIPFGVDGYFSLRDTKKNRAYVRALIDENIRNYRLVRFTENEKNGERLLKSVIVIINRK